MARSSGCWCRPGAAGGGGARRPPGPGKPARVLRFRSVPRERRVPRTGRHPAGRSHLYRVRHRRLPDSNLAGDEIIQIGAMRIVNGRLLRQESYEQLVNPNRPLARESARIHGITETMLQDQPSIGRSCRRFMPSVPTRCCGPQCGLRPAFPATEGGVDRSAVPPAGAGHDAAFSDHSSNQDAHRLEAIAERLGVSVIGRHTALGDAIVHRRGVPAHDSGCWWRRASAPWGRRVRRRSRTYYHASVVTMAQTALASILQGEVSVDCTAPCPASSAARRSPSDRRRACAKPWR